VGLVIRFRWGVIVALSVFSDAAAAEKTESATITPHLKRMTSPTRAVLARSASMSYWVGCSRQETSAPRASVFAILLSPTCNPPARVPPR
jgi:hypothetical protein